MRSAIEIMPYVRERTFSDPTARIAVERTIHSEKTAKPEKSAFTPKPKTSAIKVISTVVFESKPHPKNNNPKVGKISTIRQRVCEIESILCQFNKKKKKRLSSEEKMEREKLLVELKNIR